MSRRDRLFPAKRDSPSDRFLPVGHNPQTYAQYFEDLKFDPNAEIVFEDIFEMTSRLNSSIYNPPGNT